MSAVQAPLIFIFSWERPLYLWACLDSLRANTKTPCRFVLLDNASSDPLVHRIIDSFEARDFFYKIHRNKDNSPHAMSRALQEYKSQLGDYFGYVESDVMVMPGEKSWLEEFQELMADDPKLAMIGSLINKVDFINPDWAAKRYPGIAETQLEFLVKSKSTERLLDENYPSRTIDFINPPGRFQFLRTEAIERTGMLPDFKLSNALKALGYKTVIAARVRHRHLSLANAFDYPDYDKANRDKFWFRLANEKPTSG